MQTCKYSREDLPPPAGCCCSQKYSQSLAMVTRMPAITRCSCGPGGTSLLLKGLWINKQGLTGGAAGPHAFALPCLFLVSSAHCWGLGEHGHHPLGLFILSSFSAPSHQTLIHTIHSDTLGNIYTYTHSDRRTHTYTHLPRRNIYLYTHIHMLMLTFTHMHTHYNYIHIPLDTHIHAHTHSYIYSQEHVKSTVCEIILGGLHILKYF